MIGEKGQPDRANTNLRHDQSRGIVDALLVLGVVVQLTLSNFALEFFGIPYNSLGGSIVTKIHPATYLYSLALCIAVIANRYPVAYLAGLLSRCLGSTFLLLACLLLWVFISRYKGDQPASFLIDSIMVAALIFMLFADAGERVRLTVARVVHIYMVVNCCLSIVEGLSGWRLFPFVLGTSEQVWEYRATALLGHPLVGGLATGVYAVLLMTVRDMRGLGARWRLPILLLCMASMPFIGARTSFAVVYAVAVIVVALKGIRFLQGGAISVRALMAVMILAPLGIIAVAALFQLGLFEQFTDRFINDKGSAATRVQLFSLFEHLSLGEFLMGQSNLRLEMSVRLAGLSEGIENAWAGHALRYGFIITAVLWLGIAGWFADMLRAAGRVAVLPLAFVFLILSTTVSISGKSTMLTIPAIFLLSLVAGRKNLVEAPSPARSSHARSCTIAASRLSGDATYPKPVSR